jgi:hypothetical protein
MRGPWVCVLRNVEEYIGTISSGVQQALNDGGHAEVLIAANFDVVPVP